ncbi:MAG: hypothetical protein ABIF10_08240 [Candidatus Woesearchaeota archaeon]
MGETRILNNLEIHPDFVVVSVNPKLYPLDGVYSAASLFLENSFVLIDGDPEHEIIVELKPKDKKPIEELGREFNNELIIQTANRLRNDMESPIDACGPVDDPLGIARPWEEVYGKGGDRQGQ